MTDETDRPGILAPPPLLTIAAMLLAWGGNRILPLPLTRSADSTFRIAGAIAVLLVAVVVLVAAVRELHRHKTTPNPYQASTAVVSSGIYAYSRNPIYLAFMLIVVAVTLFANSCWFLIALALLFVVLRFGVVAREERYLSAKFGATYDTYRHSVRRWL